MGANRTGAKSGGVLRCQVRCRRCSGRFNPICFRVKGNAGCPDKLTPIFPTVPQAGNSHWSRSRASHPRIAFRIPATGRRNRLSAPLPLHIRKCQRLPNLAVRRPPSLVQIPDFRQPSARLRYSLSVARSRMIQHTFETLFRPPQRWAIRPRAWRISDPLPILGP